MTRSFGYQLLADLYGCQPAVCNDHALCYTFLNDIVDFLGMKTQDQPTLIVSDKEQYPDKEGLSGWVPLIESSVVIHTLARRGFISIDVYSCREFDQEGAIAFIRQYFHPAELESKYLLRGERYYHDA